MNIIFSDTLSCQQGNNTIKNVLSPINISIECDSSLSCNDLTISLYPDLEIKNDINLNISCYNDYSCDNLQINTNNDKNILMVINMYRYSEGIFISHYYISNIDINCGVIGDERYIEYPTDQLLDTTELLQSARNEYSSQRLPCEDIQIDCSGNLTDFEQGCEYEYQLNNSVNLENILSDPNVPNCYWIEINTFYTPYCKGTCGDPIIYYHYNISFDLILYFISNMTDFKFTTKSYRICDFYFGSVNEPMIH